MKSIREDWKFHHILLYTCIYKHFSDWIAKSLSILKIECWHLCFSNFAQWKSLLALSSLQFFLEQFSMWQQGCRGALKSIKRSYLQIEKNNALKTRASGHVNSWTHVPDRASAFFGPWSSLLPWASWSAGCPQPACSALKARYGGSNMKKINNGCRHLILYMMEDIKKVNLKNVFLWLFSVTDPLKIQNGRQI